MVKIDLSYNNAYSYYTDGDNFVIGYICYESNFYEGDKLLNLIKSIEFDKLYEVMQKVDGRFLLLRKQNEKIAIISDLLRTFPVFYQKIDNNLIICDNIMKYKNKKINNESLNELKSAVFITGKETLFNDICQIEAHQIIYIDEVTLDISTKKYFSYQYQFAEKTDEELIKELDYAYNESIKKLIQYLNGRKAVIPLSGGNDSRLVAYYLKRNNYKNVIAYTYGSVKNSEKEVSKKVAEFLDIPWYFIEYNNRSMQKKFNNKQIYKEMADYCARGYTTPHIQEWEAITQLLKNKVIDKNDSVIVTGYSGDFLIGKHITEDMFHKQTMTWKELKQIIMKIIYNHAKTTELKNSVEKKLNMLYKMKNDNEILDRDKAIELFERLDFEEREAKYITNANKTYEFQGIKCYLPLWDKDLLNKWLSINIEKRYKTNLFNKFKECIYGDLMEYVPLFENKQRKPITKPFKILKKMYRTVDLYLNGFINFYGYFHFRTYLKYIIETKEIGYVKLFCTHYIHYIEKEIKKENKHIMEN